MISTVWDDDLSVLRDRHSLRPVQRAAQCIDEGEKRTLRVEHLESRIAPVGHHDIVLLVHGHPGGRVELTVALAVGAEAEEKLPGAIKDLQR